MVGRCYTKTGNQVHTFQGCYDYSRWLHGRKSFEDILYIEFQEKTWGSALLMEIIENGDKKKYQFSVVQDWVKYPLKAPMKYMKVDWSRFVKHIKDRQIITK